MDIKFKKKNENKNISEGNSVKPFPIVRTKWLNFISS